MVALNAKEKGCVVTLLDKEVKDLIWIWLVESYDINYLIMVMVSLEKKKDVWSTQFLLLFIISSLQVQDF